MFDFKESKNSLFFLHIKFLSALFNFNRYLLKIRQAAIIDASNFHV